MITLSVSTDIDQMIQRFADSAKQRPYATKEALTRTAANYVKPALVQAMQTSFDRPTPWTLNSLYVKPATIQDQTAVVYLKDDAGSGTPADKYLTPEIKGGFRRNKRFEVALQSVGALPPGWVVVPGAACKLDAYGNIPGSLIVQILSYFRTTNVAGYAANITDKKKARLAKGTKRGPGYEYFVGRPGDGKLPLGIWQRFSFTGPHIKGSSIKPIFIFVDGANYKRLFMFDDVARQTFDREFPGQFEQAMAAANASAR